jgi:hypothetical protein
MDPQRILVIGLIVSLGANISISYYSFTIFRESIHRYDEGFTSGFEEGYDTGYLIGVEEGVGHGYSIRDPTYSEVVEFIEKDKTDEIPYNQDDFACHHYAKTVKNNAFEIGLRCYYVYIYLEGGHHTIVGFDTTDQGMIFIEPQTDEFLELVIGEHYNKLITGSIRLLGQDVILDFDVMS